MIPLLQYRTEGKNLTFKYDRVVEGFAMPMRVVINGKETVIKPTAAMQTIALPDEIKTFEINPNFYVIPLKIG